MADTYEDDFEEEEELGSALSPIEIPQSETSSLQESSRQRDQNADSAEDEDLTEEDEEEEGVSSARMTSARRRRRDKVRNGRTGIDMTPPDQLLKKAEKKAKRYTEKKKARLAIKELVRCTALSKLVYGEGHWKVAGAHANLAEGYLDLKEYAVQAQHHAETAQTIIRSGIQTSSSSTDRANIMKVNLKIFFVLGRALTVLKKYPEAEQALNKSERIAEERSNISSVSHDEIEDWKIKLYNALARLHSRQQKHAIAMEYFEKLLNQLELKYGQDSIKLVPVYQGMGNLEQSKGDQADHERAIEYFQQAHSITSAHYKDRNVEIAETAHVLATAYSSVGEADAETSAESYLTEALAIYQITHGPQHEKTLQVQDDTARLMIRTDRPEEAISLLKSTVNDKVEVYGDLSAEVAETYKLIGFVQLSQQEGEKALKALQKCRDIENLVHGSKSKKTKDTQKMIDVLLSNPNIKAKTKKLKAEELKDRPRFSSIVNRNQPLGGFKSQTY